MRTVWAIGAVLASGVFAAPSATTSRPVVLSANSTLIHKHGRWDTSPGTWWAGSGLKIVASNLSSFILNLGDITSQTTPVGLSIDYANFTTINVAPGENVIPIPPATSKKDRVVRLQVQGYYNNRMQLESIVLNAGAIVKPYKPSPLRFQFIGDSLSAGYENPNGINDAWTFITAQNFKAEHNIQAQPGACLTDQLCYSNARGMSFEFFRTEDTGYYYTWDHNYTTPWDFSKDVTPTHVFIVIGANDNSYSITPENFGKTLSEFITKLRTLYAKQDIFVFTPWGWPAWDGFSPFSTYYDGVYGSVVANKTAAGDKHIHLVNTTGWVGYDGVIPNDGHPNTIGQLQVASHLSTWLQKWGLKPVTSWAS
ncbi:hypothetical protein FS749_011141 [Ceratobasidium sp. UAMH 11750]|nr:hypothetical protein FS749_011141 [Ceratobasidium sp. UAMH 11750]